MIPIALMVAAAGVSNGIGRVLLILGLVLLGIGLGVVVVGRARWARLPNRKSGALAAAVGLVMLVAGTAVAPSPAHRTDKLAATAPPVAFPSALPSASTASPSASTAPAPPTSANRAAEAAARTAVATLGTLAVKGRSPKTGYDRAQFGPAWADVDRNGCDTRNDILGRDLPDKTVKAGTRDCVVLTGTLADPYSGRTIRFVRGDGTSTAVQIDHVVALSDAWQKGAQPWAAAQREAFANDRLNLLAVDGPLNEQKGDGDATTWLPPNKAFRCAYTARQVAIKAKYALWVTPAEQAAIAEVLSTCSDEPLPAADTVPS